MYGLVWMLPNRAIHAKTSDMTYLAERQGTSYHSNMYGLVWKHPNRAIHIICDMTYLAFWQGTSFHITDVYESVRSVRTDSYTS